MTEKDKLEKVAGIICGMCHFEKRCQLTVYEETCCARLKEKVPEILTLFPDPVMIEIDCGECKGTGGERVYSLTPFVDGNWKPCSACNGTGKQIVPAKVGMSGRIVEGEIV